MSRPRKPKPAPLVVDRTGRGFAIANFVDRYGVACHIQDSSLATEACIWLGADEIGLRKLILGRGWHPVPLEQGGVSHVANTCMHLTRDQVRALLPLLRRFVKTGTIAPPPT